MLNDCCLETKNLIEGKSKLALAGDVREKEQEVTLRRCSVCSAVHYTVNKPHRIFLAKDMQMKDGSIVLRVD